MNLSQSGCRWADLPWCADKVVEDIAKEVGFSLVESYRFVFPPPGLHEDFTGRGFQLQHLRTGAAVLINEEMLFAGGGEGNLEGSWERKLSMHHRLCMYIPPRVNK